MKKKRILLISTIIFLNIFYKDVAYAYDKINGIEISKQLIKINYTKGIKINPKYIVIHDTDNRDKGADAKANRDFFANHKEAKVSAHYVVDENNIVQVLEDNWLGWHSGEIKNDKMNNNNSIAIEMCVNKDNNFDKTFDNTIELTKKLMKKYNIPKENVIRHHDITGKTCPKMIIVDRPNLWGEFKERISTFNDEKDIQGLDEKEVYKTYANKEKEDAKVYDNKEKYINKSGQIINITTLLNVRKDPTKASAIIDCIENGQNVQVLNEKEDWFKIIFKRKNNYIEGYVKKEYVLIKNRKEFKCYEEKY